MAITADLRPATCVSLEEQYANEVCCDVNVYSNVFTDYLVPNEVNPEGIIPHLRMAESASGIIVSTGTERSFFDLLFSNKATCEGIVIRDINPRVKAYVDFNVLLLRISKTREEYLELSKSIDFYDNEAFNKRISVISEKMKQIGLNKKISEYYLKNINNFARVYLCMKKGWRGEGTNSEQAEYFNTVSYDQNDAQFAKLKEYAQSGNIICTIGQINDLSFLEQRKINVVDTSNIDDYSIIDPQGKGDFHPRIIWTCLYFKTKYLSYPFKTVSYEERLEINKTFDEIRNIVSYRPNKEDPDGFVHWLKRLRLFSLDEFNNDTGPFFTTNTLNAVKCLQQKFLEFPRIGLIDMFNTGDYGGVKAGGNGIIQINRLTLAEIHESCEKVEIKQFLPQLVKEWKVFANDLSKYLAFSRIDGWVEHFNNLSLDPSFHARFFVNELEEQRLTDRFIKAFGEKAKDAENFVLNHKFPG